MRHTTIAALALTLPALGCSMIGPTPGISLNSQSPRDAQREAPSSSDAPAASTPRSGASSPTAASHVFATPTAPPAPNVEDSVGPIPRALVVAPSAGAPVISLQGVSWCSDQVKGQDWGESAESKFKQAMKNVGSVYISGIESIASVGRFACGGTRSADRLTWVQSYMQAQANELGINQAHMTHLFSVIAPLQSFDLRDFANEAPAGCDALKAKRNANALDSASAELARVGAGCASPSSADWMSWGLDRGIDLKSQVHAMGWVYAAIGYGQGVASFNRGIMALRDANGLEAGAYFTDLKELGADDQVIAKGIFRYYDTMHQVAEWQAQHKDELGEDYETLVNESVAAFAAWEKAYKADKAGVDYAFAIEEAVVEGDKRRFESCSEKGGKFAMDYVMRGKPKSIEDIRQAASTPIGTLILAGAFECEKAMGQRLMASAYAAMLQDAPVVRGPRFAALLAVGRKVAEIQTVKSRFALKTRDFKPYVPNGAFGQAQAGYFQSASGTVTRTEKKGDLMTVYFKKDSWKEPVFKCHETNRLDRIDAQGKLVYRQVCKRTGTRDMSSQEKPINIPVALGYGIKSGSFVVAARSKEDASQGIARQVFSSKSREELVNYYGLQLR